MTIIGLHHVQITIPHDKEDAARAFYLGVFGLPEVEKPDSLKPRGGFWVDLGDRQLHIAMEDGVDRSLTKAHVAYQVDDLERWRDKLTAAALSILDSVPIPDFNRFECRDPFGNRMEFIEAL